MDRNDAERLLRDEAGDSADVNSIPGKGADSWVYCLKLPEDFPDEEVDRIAAQWDNAWADGKAPKLVILPLGASLEGPLPGRYAVSLELDDYKLTVTFQEYHELMKYLETHVTTQDE